MKIRDKLPSDGSRRPVKSASISERLQKIMGERQIKQVDLVRETGIDKGSISHYVSGRYEPKQEYVNKLAAAIGVSAMWLSGYDVPMEKSALSIDEENPYVAEVSDDLEGMAVSDQIFWRDATREFKENPEKMKNSLTELKLSEGEALMLELFRRIPEDRQGAALELLRAALKMQ